MKKYNVKITDKAVSNMEDIYNYIAEQLHAPEMAMGKYIRIAEAIETLRVFCERSKLIEPKEEYGLELRQLYVDNYSVFYHIVPLAKRKEWI